jgi:hypothetical protein
MGEEILPRKSPAAVISRAYAATGHAAPPSSDMSSPQVGARICNGLGIMRACLETQKLEQLECALRERACIRGRSTCGIGRGS